MLRRPRLIEDEETISSIFKKKINLETSDSLSNSDEDAWFNSVMEKAKQKEKRQNRDKEITSALKRRYEMSLKLTNTSLPSTLPIKTVNRSTRPFISNSVIEQPFLNNLLSKKQLVEKILEKSSELPCNKALTNVKEEVECRDRGTYLYSQIVNEKVKLPEIKKRKPIYQQLIELSKNVQDILLEQNPDEDVVEVSTKWFYKYSPGYSLDDYKRYEVIVNRRNEDNINNVINDEENKCPFGSNKYEATDVNVEDVLLLECLILGGKKLNLAAIGISVIKYTKEFESTLTFLDISWNNFKVLPQEICHCRKLQVLKVRNNPIRNLPTFLGNFSDLTTFDASYCLLEELGIGIYRLQNLKSLDLSYNFLKFLDNSIINLKKLSYLKLTGNDILGVPPRLLQMCQYELTDLMLELNPLLSPLGADIDRPLSNPHGMVQKLSVITCMALAAHVNRVTTGFTRYPHTDSPASYHTGQLSKLLTLGSLQKTQHTSDENGQDDKDEKNFIKFNLQYWWTNYANAEQIKPRKGICSWCDEPRYDDGLLVTRCCTEVFSYHNLPVVFNCCKPACYFEALHCSGSEFGKKYYESFQFGISPAASTVLEDIALQSKLNETDLTLDYTTTIEKESLILADEVDLDAPPSSAK